MAAGYDKSNWVVASADLSDYLGQLPVVFGYVWGARVKFQMQKWKELSLVRSVGYLVKDGGGATLVWSNHCHALATALNPMFVTRLYISYQQMNLRALIPNIPFPETNNRN